MTPPAGVKLPPTKDGTARHHQGVDLGARAGQAGAEGRPVSIVGIVGSVHVPLRDAIGGDDASGGEGTANIQGTAGQHQGFDRVVQAATEGRPGATVPLGNAVGLDGAHGGKAAADIEPAIGAVVDDRVHETLRPWQTRIPHLPVGVGEGRINGQRVAGGGVRGP